LRGHRRHASADGAFSAGRRLHRRAGARGQAVYDKQCASCHGSLKGRLPRSSADAFAANWQGQPLSELATKIQKTMPADGPAR
jgi:mono/diheme cytochrome c family protein